MAGQADLVYYTISEQETMKLRNRTTWTFSLCVCMFVSVCVYVYVCIYRGRDRETHRETDRMARTLTHRVYFGVFVVLISDFLAHC